MKLLLVEDEADLNRSLTKLLKKEHFSVDSAFDGEEALEFLEMVDYDLIILDIMMPRMDGFAFLEKIRQAGKQVVVLVLTARDSLEDKIREQMIIWSSLLSLRNSWRGCGLFCGASSVSWLARRLI